MIVKHTEHEALRYLDTWKDTEADEDYYSRAYRQV